MRVAKFFQQAEERGSREHCQDGDGHAPDSGKRHRDHHIGAATGAGEDWHECEDGSDGRHHRRAHPQGRPGDHGIPDAVDGVGAGVGLGAAFGLGPGVGFALGVVAGFAAVLVAPFLLFGGVCR